MADLGETLLASEFDGWIAYLELKHEREQAEIERRRAESERGTGGGKGRATQTYKRRPRGK